MKAKKVLRHMAVAMATGTLALAGALTGAGSAQAAYDPTTHSIWGDEQLLPGWHVDSVSTRLIMQDDGNLVIYHFFDTPQQKVAFATGTNVNHCGYRAVMQSDGNLVVYSANGGVCWSLGTNGHWNAKLTVNDSGTSGVYWGPTRLPLSNKDGGDSYSHFLSSDLY